MEEGRRERIGSLRSRREKERMGECEAVMSI